MKQLSILFFSCPVQQVLTAIPFRMRGMNILSGGFAPSFSGGTADNMTASFNPDFLLLSFSAYVPLNLDNINRKSNKVK